MSAQLLNINLLPAGIRSEQYGGKFLAWALTYGRYIIIITELIVLVAFFSRFFFDQKLADLHELIEHKQAIILSVADFEKEVRYLQDRIARIGELEKGHSTYLREIQHLSTIVPDDVILSNLSFTGKKISLKVIAYSRRGVSQFIQALKQSSEFQTISLGAIESPKGGGPLTFQLTMELKDVK